MSFLRHFIWGHKRNDITYFCVSFVTYIKYTICRKIKQVSTTHTIFIHLFQIRIISWTWFLNYRYLIDNYQVWTRWTFYIFILVICITIYGFFPQRIVSFSFLRYRTIAFKSWWQIVKDNVSVYAYSTYVLFLTTTKIYFNSNHVWNRLSFWILKRLLFSNSVFTIHINHFSYNVCDIQHRLLKTSIHFNNFMANSASRKTRPSRTITLQSDAINANLCWLFAF